MATNELANPDRTESEAAQEAAQQAVAQARRTATQAVTTIKAMSFEKLVYLGCLTTVVVCTLIFDMASFTVGVDCVQRQLNVPALLGLPFGVSRIMPTLRSLCLLSVG